MSVRLGAKVVDALLLGPSDRRRQLQDFPVLGDVWTRIAERPPGDPPDLLIVPAWEKSAASVAHLISEAGERHNDDLSRSVAYLNNLVVATLSLDDLAEVIFPATIWWDRIEDGWASAGVTPPKRDQLAGMIRFELEQSVGKGCDTLFMDLEYPSVAPRNGDDAQAARLGSLLGMFMAAHTDAKAGEVGEAPSLDPITVLAAALEKVGSARVIDQGARAVQTVRTRYAQLANERGGDGLAWNGLIYQATLNRDAEYTLTESVGAIKADAARSLFSISCREAAWAVLDSGIDHTHPAFLDHREILKRKAKQDPGKPPEEVTLEYQPHRIKAAFDFRRIRAILGIKPKQLGTLAQELAEVAGLEVTAVEDLLGRIIRDREAHLPTDWRKIRKLIEIDIGEKVGSAKPEHAHGTHVAGIIGADWRDEKGQPKLQGVCPDIKLYDCRVLGSDLGDSEFAVSAAIQFIRFFNEQSEHPRINGVNMSLAIRHNVRNYACGRTPVCLEAEALVASGVVVVAAAGNRGYQSYQLADSSTSEGYAASSITDPGNADGVITVGATHRAWPHTYGVSFFSSRGPTGDGRPKPDLLAPGEKITSCTPGGKQDQMDGTSMAAPHVSGAAALLMARHEELKGRPARIKEILCETATDLKRERSFQGRGMVDVLRAIQSI